MDQKNVTECLEGTYYIRYNGKIVYGNTEKENTEIKEGQLAKHNE